VWRATARGFGRALVKIGPDVTSTSGSFLFRGLRRWALDSRAGTTLSSRVESGMHNEFTAVFERDGEWFLAYSPEIPGANGQGLTKDQARESLIQAIELILADRRESGLRGVPENRSQAVVLALKRGLVTLDE
jgi:predicted RNase H-like HicB family nuclease